MNQNSTHFLLELFHFQQEANPKPNPEKKQPIWLLFLFCQILLICHKADCKCSYTLLPVTKRYSKQVFVAICIKKELSDYLRKLIFLVLAEWVGFEPTHGVNRLTIQQTVLFSQLEYHSIRLLYKYNTNAAFWQALFPTFCTIFRATRTYQMPACAIAFSRKWRKGWDSNPRRACTLASFQDWSLKPLGHLSVTLLLYEKTISASSAHAKT